MGADVNHRGILMTSNFDAYRKDLDRLIKRAEMLLYALHYKCDPKSFLESLGDKKDEYLKLLPSFNKDYQAWYSEALSLIRQLLPDRLDDFRRHYEKPKTRKTIDFENYRVEDCLQGLQIENGIGERICGPSSAIPQFEQQVAILKSVESRFTSALFDIKQLVMADLFDSELETAHELRKKGFLRGAGAIAGVVLEKHLAQVLDNHGIKVQKKNPCINDYNECLKTNSVIDTPIWRNVQRLGDIRNLCDHNKERALPGLACEKPLGFVDCAA